MRQKLKTRVNARQALQGRNNPSPGGGRSIATDVTLGLGRAESSWTESSAQCLFGSMLIRVGVFFLTFLFPHST